MAVSMYNKCSLHHERKKSLLWMLYKSFECRPEIGSKQLTNLSQNLARPEKPGPTYNSVSPKILGFLRYCL